MPPLYEFRCTGDHVFEMVLPVSEYQSRQKCTKCGAIGRRIISLPLAVYVQRECRYDSPVTGAPISSWKQRKEDLARHGCQEYDPGMRVDAERFRQREQQKLEKSVDATVEEFVEKLPSRKKEALATEMQGGADAQIVRSTVPAP